MREFGLLSYNESKEDYVWELYEKTRLPLTTLSIVFGHWKIAVLYIPRTKDLDFTVALF